ncbi:MAG: hypothetical protein Q9163_004953 [Psora crenata]
MIASRIPLRFVYALLLFYTLLIGPTSAVTCWTQESSPSSSLPAASDCRELATRLSNNPSAHINQIFSKVSVPARYLKLPQMYSYNTCFTLVNIHVEPYYDIARLSDIAKIIDDVVLQCLEPQPQRGNQFGGRDITGGNKWLVVSVSGKYTNGNREKLDIRPHSATNNEILASPNRNLNYTQGNDFAADSDKMTEKRWVA